MMIRIALKLKEFVLNKQWTDFWFVSCHRLIRNFSQFILVTVTSEVYNDDSDKYVGFYYNRI